MRMGEVYTRTCISLIAVQFVFFFAGSQLFSESMSDFVIAETEYGQVKGVKKVSALSTEYEAFLGIPFASPPVGELRFKVICETKLI